MQPTAIQVLGAETLCDPRSRDHREPIARHREVIRVNPQDPRLMTITTAPQLADLLNVKEKTLRSWLRKDFPEHAPGQGAKWRLTPEMNRRMAKRAGHS